MKNFSPQQTEDILLSLTQKPRNSFEDELERRLSQESPSHAQSSPSKKHFSWKPLFWSLTPVLLLLAFFLSEPNFVKAQIGDIIAAGKKILFGEYSFTFNGDKKFPGTYITFNSLIDEQNISEKAEAVLKENQKALEDLITQTPETIEKILVRDDTLTGEIYIVLLGKNNVPLRGGIISTPESMPEAQDIILNSLCDTLEYKIDPLTSSTQNYIYTNPNWGLSYTVPRIKGLEPGQICGGGGGFNGSALAVTTQFSPTTTEESVSPPGFIGVGVIFPQGDIPEETKKNATKVRIGTEEWWVEKDGKTFSLLKNGFRYVIEYDTTEQEEKEYEQIAQEILQSIQITEPNLFLNYQAEAIFLELWNKDEIYTLRGELWQKNPTYPIETEVTKETEITEEVSVSPFGDKIELPFELIFPTESKIITQYFGLNHNGIDIAGKTGEEIKATAAGTVTTAQCGWNGGYGCYIILDHGNGITSLYANNDTLIVSEGEKVSAGQKIAELGSTGRSTGSHMHFEIRQNEKSMNPMHYLNI